jgi:hypothetical protein
MRIGQAPGWFGSGQATGSVSITGSVHRGSQDPFDQAAHPVVMRALPIDTTAGLATSEIDLLTTRPEWESVLDDLASDRLEQSIAAEAPPERRDGSCQVEPANDLRKLGLGAVGSDPVTAPYHGALQQPDVASQEDAVIATR